MFVLFGVGAAAASATVGLLSNSIVVDEKRIFAFNK